MWTLEKTDDWGRRFKNYEKKHPKELATTLDNLDTFHKSLNCGVKPQQAKFGSFILSHSGFLQLTKKGRPNLAQTRLYVYPDEERNVLHLLTLGDKNSQKSDISTSKGFVAQLRQEDQKTHEPKKGSH